jgi:hypothetical protein
MAKNPHRRRWQFRIRALLAAVAVIAVVAAAIYYARIPFRGGQRASTSLVDCRSTRLALYLTNKTDETVCYLIYSARAVGRIDPPPADSWDVVIAPRATVALSADEIFGHRRRGDKVVLLTWIADPVAGQGAKKQDETVYFTP